MIVLNALGVSIMKKKIIITIIILVTTVLLGVGGYFIFALNQGPATIEDSEADFESTLLEAPKDGTNPSEHSVEENVAYALWTIANTNDFYTLTTGTAQASIATQQIYNKRVVHDGKAMVTMISSGLISTAKQKYYMKDKVLLRDATSISGDTATWITSEPECVSYKTIINRYGWLPFQATGYIICSDTYTNKEEMKMVDNQDGTYTLYFDLDPDGNKAPFWYRREVLTNANSAIVPEFAYIHFEMKINSNWQIVSTDIQETYKVKSMGVEAITKTNCHEEYFYENVAFDEEPYNYFESYAYLSVLEDDENPMDNALDPMSIIVESLQNSDKSNKNLELNIAGDGFKKNGLVALNISDLSEIKVYADFGDLYVEYTDNIYISIGGTKVKANVEELTNIFSKITEVLPDQNIDGVSLDVNKIMADLSKSTLVDDGENVSIDTNLDILGIKLPIHFDIKHVGDTYALKSAYANVDLFGTKVELSIKETNKKISPKSHNDFMDLANLEFIVSDIASIIKNKSLDFSLELKYQDILGIAKGNISFKDGIHLDMNVEVSYKNNSISMDLYYFNDVIYLSMMNAKLKITTKDLLRLIEKYTNKAIDLSYDFDMSSLLKTIFTIDYDSLLKELVIEEDSLDIAISLKQFTNIINEIKLSIKDSNKGLDGSISIDDIKASFSLGDLGYKVRAIEDSQYSHLAYLEGFIDDILAIYKDKKLEVTLDISYKDLSATIDSIIDFENELALMANIDLNYKNKNFEIEVLYLEDCIYFSYSNIHIKLNTKELMEFIKEYTDFNSNMDVSNILNTILSLDFEKLLQKLEIKENNITLDLDLSILLEALGVLHLNISRDEKITIDVSMGDALGNIYISSTNKKVEKKNYEYYDFMALKNLLKQIVDLYNAGKMGFSLNTTIKNIDISASGILSFKDSIQLDLELNIQYKNQSYVANIIYIEDTFYLSFYNVKLKISKDDVFKLINKFSDGSSTDILDTLLSIDFEKLFEEITIEEDLLSIKADLSAVMDSLGELAIALKKNMESISIDAIYFDTVLNLNVFETVEEVSIPNEEEYYNLGYLDPILEDILAIYKDKKLEVTLDISYKDLSATIDSIIDFENELALMANIDLNYKNKNFEIEVLYLEDCIYFSYSNIHIKLNTKELMEFIKEYTDFNSNMDVSNILNTILSLDFEKLLQKLEIKENNITLDLDLSILLEALGVLHLNISRDEKITIDVSMGDALGNIYISSTNKKVEKKNYEYYDFMALKNLLKQIVDLYNAGKMGFSLNTTIKNIDISASGILSFKDSIQLDLELNIQYKNQSYVANIIYIEDTFYLSFYNVKLKISKDDVFKLINKFSDGSSTDILDTLLSIDFEKLFEEITIEEDLLSIKADLSAVMDSLGELAIALKKNMESISIDAIYFDTVLNLNVFETVEEVSIPNEEEYYNLGYLDPILEDILAITKEKHLAIKMAFSYNELTCTILGNLDFNEELKANMSIDFDYKNKNIHIDLYYLEDILYFDLEDIHLKISKDDLVNIIGLFMESDLSILDSLLQMDLDKLIEGLRITEEEFELDLNISEILDSLSKIQITLKDSLGSIDGVISIKDLMDISIMVNDSYNGFELPEIEYQDLGEFYEFFVFIKDLMEHESIVMDLNFKHEDLSVLGEINLSIKEEFQLTSSIHVKYQDLNISFNASYFDKYQDYEKVLLVDLYKNHLMIPVSMFIEDDTNISINDILDILFDSDFISMIESIVINSNSFEMNMNLSNIELLNSFFNDLSHMDLKIILDGSKLNLTSNSFGIFANISLSNDKVVKPEEEYVDLSDMVSNVLELISWVNKESFRISLDGSANISSIKMDLNGYIDLLFNAGQYDLSGYFHIEVYSTLHDIYFKYHMGILYLYYGDVIFGIDMNQPKEFLEDVLEALEIEMPKLTQDKLDSILNHLNIKSSGFDLDLSSLIDMITKITFILSYNKDYGTFNLNIDSTELDIDGSVEKIDFYSITLPESYLDNEDILSLAKMVRRILNLIENKAFNVHFDLDTIDSGSKHLNILGDLSIFLDIPLGEKLSLDYISLCLNLAITEYDPNGGIKVVHRLDLKFVNDMIYIIYGNNESNLASKIKFNLDKNSLLSTLASITSVLGIHLDFLNDYLDSSLENVDFHQLTDLFKMDSRTIDVSKILKALDIDLDSIHLALSSNVLNENIPESNLIDLDLVSNDTTPLSLSIHGLYTDYVSSQEYTRIDVNEVMVSLDPAHVLAPSSLDGYYDISDLDELVNGLLVTGSNKDYEIKSTVTLGLPIIKDINVPIDARIRVLEDGDPLIYLHINLTEITTAAQLLGLTKKNVYFYYQDGYVYIYRLDNDGTSYKLKITKEELFDDIIYYLLDFSLGMPNIILNAINSSSTDPDYVIDAGTVINSYSYSNHRFNISLDMESLTGNSNLGDLSLGLLLKNIAVSKNEDSSVNTAYALTEIVDFNFDLVSVINLSTSSLKLTNLEDMDGYTWFKNIEMEDVVSFISSYSYGTDLIYKNDSYYGKRSHLITFVLNHGENQYFTGQYGTTIEFPKLEVVEDSSKYYLFKGWYKDKYLHEPFLGTTVLDSNMKLYAKWEEVSYYSLNIHSISGDKNYSLYNGEDLSKYLNEKVYTDSLGNSYILKGYSLSIDGDLIDIESMPKYDLDLYAKWDIISYKVYIDDSYYMDLSSSTSLSLTHDYYLKANDIYFCFEASYLTYDVLAILYNEYVTIEDGIGYIYLYSELSLEDYYKVSLDYDYHKFSDKLYKAIVLPKSMDFSSDLLPNSIYNHMKINYWYNEEIEYHYGNIDEMLHEDITLSAYYATYDYLSFGYDQSSGEELISVTGFSYQESLSIRVILPKYVYINNSYEILRALLINVDSDNNKYSCFTGCENISTIIFNDGFRIIGDNAFKNCKNLTKVYFSNTVEAVASDAFYMNSKDEAKNIRFYLHTSSTLNTDKWLAYKGTFGTKYYYGETNGLFGENLTSAFNTYSDRISDIVRAMI